MALSRRNHPATRMWKILKQNGLATPKGALLSLCFVVFIYYSYGKISSLSTSKGSRLRALHSNTVEEFAKHHAKKAMLDSGMALSMLKKSGWSVKAMIKNYGNSTSQEAIKKIKPMMITRGNRTFLDVNSVAIKLGQSLKQVKLALLDEKYN